MELLIVILVLALTFACWKWWTYRCMSLGLIYFAIKEHNWNINDEEIKKILEYSMTRNIKDLL